ncbi:hypothetical protein A3D01_02910 [Candidatus Woesebacteria bacterium RIFCSPHIGHO2_02_FULL_39_13]|uniref:HAD-IIB family hydrolase n=1 Tax=Candidatus Woesebacteria bacterium RIFCSPHIGHO2_02_FULL_39_13 TaxID=1802505 RepID=A0A1F7YXR0_9BACT|nr:MAG: hypothetical protein A3D01_02910 [Candidatus Woesebacteria bacterium RIFCSPHIGHO2_02_FULL_39_13]OGM36890.1 MAG: hypothetical protein A3E13_01850 [Candidatus Woesebacteria bacterium RIFCSPHIGHO2_12_FULL_40_20]OGM72129.1 MAG: hypothetical protein A3H19_05560 [Candidatus Woesebacteria bacterium RIFCSPLOWO2_12_FULL_39_9]
MSNEKIKSVLAFDLDGTLTPRNKFDIHPKGLSELLNYLDKLSHLVIPVTGKPVSYAENIFSTNALEDRGIIAENAGVYRKPGSKKVEVYGPSLDEIKKLRDLIGIGMDKVNVTKIKLFEKEYEVSIDAGDVSILTVFTDPSFVTHRWSFKHEIQANECVEKLNIIIENNSWGKNLEVLAPFPDGGVQVIRKDPKTGKSVDKSSIIRNLHTMYPDLGNVPIAMFGDGHNDIPAMKPKEIIPLTFSNAHDEVIAFVKNKGGFVSEYEAPERNGVVDGIKWLANRNFFGKDKGIILETAKRYSINRL